MARGFQLMLTTLITWFLWAFGQLIIIILAIAGVVWVFTSPSNEPIIVWGYQMSSKGRGLFFYVFVVLVASLIWRIICEGFAVVFNINDLLSEALDSLRTIPSAMPNSPTSYDIEKAIKDALEDALSDPDIRKAIKDMPVDVSPEGKNEN